MFNLALLKNVFGIENKKDKTSEEKNRILSKDELADFLKTNKEALRMFEEAYQRNALSVISDNLFDISKQQAKQIKDEQEVKSSSLEIDETDISSMVERIVDELLEETFVWSTRQDFHGSDFVLYEDSIQSDEKSLSPMNPVQLEEITKLPESIRPQLTGRLMMVDINQPSYPMLLTHYKNYLEEKNVKVKRHFYHMFRQGLDILDLDAITYQMLGANKNSMGYWLPRIYSSVCDEGFFKIPETTIIKVPLPLLQLTRKDYANLTKTTFQILDRFAQKAFRLDLEKEYFIKTGTYSSKFDFRNAHVYTPKEVAELGEYLLFIHYQAICMAHYDLSGRNQPCIYGVSTTNEWCVREFIKDLDWNPTIYNGLPLHTEYRVFVDFDTKNVLYCHPYWDKEVMKKRFGESSDSNKPKMIHDYITYSSCEEKLYQKYLANKDMVVSHVKELLSKETNLSGQWSVDIMQNGNDFYLIDMALAENSAFYEHVPQKLKRVSEENWLPERFEI